MHAVRTGFARLFVVAAITVSLSARPALAAPADREEAPVRINDIRNPALKPYRVMLAGQEAFDDNHELAPTAKELRFRLRPKAGAPESEMENLSLRLAGDDGSIPIPLDARHTFVMPRDVTAAGDNADFVLNKKKGDYRWEADIHSEGVPAGMRRLGDLRLECRVLVAVAKKEIPFWIRALITSFLLTENWCGVEKLQITTRVGGKIGGAVLVEGERRLKLKLSDEGRGFLAPLGDKTFSDDALIELQAAE